MDLASARCKIYAYDVHAATGVHYLPAHKHPASWSERHRYSTEIWLNRAIARHPWRVRSLRDADVIFVVGDWSLLCSAGKTYSGRRLWSGTVKAPTWQCPSSSPAPPQGTPGGSEYR